MSTKTPLIYDYNDYRAFLKDYYQTLKEKNPRLSETAFCQMAGAGKNTRGYFSLILKGKRNLSSEMILGFIKAMKLNEDHSDYFENLVHFNQTESIEKKEYYFNKLEKLSKKKKSIGYEILKCQYHFYSKWYYVAIRELIDYKEFSGDLKWIESKLRGRVTAVQIKEAIADLIKLNLVYVDKKGRLQNNAQYIQSTDRLFNQMATLNYHQQLLEVAKDSLQRDGIDKRSFNNLLLTCQWEDFPKMREEIGNFLIDLMNRYAKSGQTFEDDKKCIYSMSVNLFPISE